VFFCLPPCGIGPVTEKKGEMVAAQGFFRSRERIPVSAAAPSAASVF
jgi:hypothetical protein